jgi:aryl-alcohol dehydrogenase-like predicted oxidoreductase
VWVLAQARIVAIPGTKRVRYLEENAAADTIRLTDEQLERLSAAVPVARSRGSGTRRR